MFSRLALPLKTFWKSWRTPRRSGVAPAVVA